MHQVERFSPRQGCGARWRTERSECESPGQLPGGYAQGVRAMERCPRGYVMRAGASSRLCNCVIAQDRFLTVL